MIRKKQPKKEIIIDLTGPDGNAFVLIGKAMNFAKIFGLNQESIKQEMTSGDYENLLRVFDKHFGHFVILER
tara:strand:+ start:887 stop:1102 length:216 start_codon:yes stop_codon:yes gene_type:complete